MGRLLISPVSNRGTLLGRAAQKLYGNLPVPTDEERQKRHPKVCVYISAGTLFDELSPAAFEMPATSQRDAVLGTSAWTWFRP